MKTITAVLIFIVVLVWAYTFVETFAAKQDFDHCMMMTLDAAITDADIAATVRQCELASGYTLNPELLP